MRRVIRSVGVAVGLAGSLLGPVPAAATTAEDICPTSSTTCIVNTVWVVSPDSVLDFGDRDLVLPGGSGRRLEVPSGSMTIRARNLTIQPGSALLGGPGTLIDIVTTGDITVRRSGSTRARIDVSDPLEPGVLLLTAGGDVVIDGVLSAAGTGFDGGDGLIEVSADGDIQIQGEVLAAAGGNSFGGDVTLVARATLSVAGVVDVSGGDGGSLSLSGDEAVVLTSSGPAQLNAQGTNLGGDGGDVEIESATGSIRMALPLRSNGASEIDIGGSGGFIEFFAPVGSVFLQGPIDASGALPDGDGGSIEVVAGLDIVHTGAITALGKQQYGGGGTVDFDAERTLTMGPIDASVDCSADSCLGGDVFAFARCEVTVPLAVAVRAIGPGGRITLATGGDMTIAGSLSAGFEIVLRHRLDTVVPDLTGAVISPPPNVVIDANVPPCPCSAGVCGDDVLNCGEVCDDGNRKGCDGCAATCRAFDRVCGDGIQECGEACDDGNLTDCDGCSRRCKIERCGNGLVECEEACDDGRETPTCRADCELPPPPGCGDGVREDREACDDGNLEDCDGCNRLCEVEACGNGVVECSEECDDFNLDACDGCSRTCRVEVCGNGDVDCGEECDDGPRNGQPGATCLADVCRVGTVCTVGGESPCIPCAGPADCDPLGLCAGVDCVEGICEPNGLVCGDDNPCTADGCDPESGCISTLLPASEVPECDDGDPCTIAECDAVLGCLQRDFELFAGISCHFEVMDTLLALEDLDRKAQRVLTKLRTKAAARVAAAVQSAADGKRRKLKKRLRATLRFLRIMRVKTEKFARKRIPPDFARDMTEEIEQTLGSLEQTQQAFGF